MNVLVNGVETVLEPGTSVEALVARTGTAARGVAVAVGDDVVPRSAWATHRLGEGDRVEILTALQGG